MPSARLQAGWAPASSTSSPISASRSGPSSGELSASTRRGGPSPPTRLVSDGGSSTITVETLAQGVNGDVPGQAGSAISAGGGGGGGGSGAGGGAMHGSGGGGGGSGASAAISTTGASGASGASGATGSSAGIGR